MEKFVSFESLQEHLKNEEERRKIFVNLDNFSAFRNLLLILEKEYKNGYYPALTQWILEKYENERCAWYWLLYDMLLDRLLDRKEKEELWGMRKAKDSYRTEEIREFYLPISNGAGKHWVMDAKERRELESMIEYCNDNYVKFPSREAQDRKKLEDLQKEIREEENKLKQAKADRKDQESKRDGANHERRDAQEELNKLQGRQKALEREVQSLESQQHTLQSEVNKLQNEKNALPAKIQAKREELEKQLQVELAEKKQVALQEIQSEREKVIQEFRNDPERAAMEQEREEYLSEVRGMVEGRKELKKEIVDEMHEVSRGFREDSTNKVSAIKVQMESMVANINDILAQMQNQTNGAINQVVALERRLEQDNFADLLVSYKKLEEQLFHRRRKLEEKQDDNPEIQEALKKEFGMYQKRTVSYLRGFGKTLSKLGYERFIPQCGEVCDADLMDIYNDDSNDYPDNADEYKEFEVSAVLSSGFRREGYVECKALVEVRRKSTE